MENNMGIAIEEAKKMVGTEFEYIFTDGDSIRAYVKKFDPEIGLTCLSLDTVTENGWKDPNPEEDGTMCVIAFDFKNPHHEFSEALSKLEEIRDTGKYLAIPGYGSISCAFS
jgi:hypothetical protein